MRMDYSRFVVGYHGCDASLTRKVLLGDEVLTPSNNAYDWLGRGSYFWEHGPARAMQFAIEESKRKSSKIKDPSVIGAYIYLGDCFDLLDVQFTSILEAVYPSFIADLKDRGESIPENRVSRADGTKLLHPLDRAVIEYAIKLVEEEEGRIFDTVRGAFWEGGPAFENSEIQRQSHIQIAVRNPECILGYFKPKPNRSRLTGPKS